MNIVFFGSSNFAVPSLKALITKGEKISCVVTQPDRQKGRGLTLESTQIKRVSLEFGLRVYQPQKVNTPEVIQFLRDLSPDLFVVIAYGQILGQEILNIPKIFSINVHGSLLPKYRGAAPINWAIIKGEKTAGITIIKMVREMDAGPIILQQEINISDDDTAITLGYKLSRKACEILPDVIKNIEIESYKLIDQDEGKASFAPRLKKEDGLIPWDKPAQDIYNLIRGCFGWPGAFTYYQGKLLKIYKARVSSRVLGFLSSQVRRLPGEIINVSKEGIVVATGEDSLVIEELQLEGKRRMKAEEFIAGHKILPKEILGKNK
jgi:methionyl-tRNA formyltransferase